jgi:hypothetical protein
VTLRLIWTLNGAYTSIQILAEKVVITVFYILIPVAIAGLFGFAIFADRHFRDAATFTVDESPGFDDEPVRVEETPLVRHPVHLHAAKKA